MNIPTVSPGQPITAAAWNTIARHDHGRALSPTMNALAVKNAHHRTAGTPTQWAVEWIGDTFQIQPGTVLINGVPLAGQPIDGLSPLLSSASNYAAACMANATGSTAWYLTIIIPRIDYDGNPQARASVTLGRAATMPAAAAYDPGNPDAAPDSLSTVLLPLAAVDADGNLTQYHSGPISFTIPTNYTPAPPDAISIIPGDGILVDFTPATGGAPDVYKISHDPAYTPFPPDTISIIPGDGIQVSATAADMQTVYSPALKMRIESTSTACILYATKAADGRITLHLEDAGAQTQNTQNIPEDL